MGAMPPGMSGAPGGMPGGVPTQAQYENAQKQQEDMQDKQDELVHGLLSAEAMARLNNLGLVKPEKKQALVAHLFKLANAGQLGREKISDKQLEQMLKTLADSVRTRVARIARDPKRERPCRAARSLALQTLPMLTVALRTRSPRSRRAPPAKEM